MDSKNLFDYSVLPKLPKDLVLIEMEHLPNLWFGCNKATMEMIKNLDFHQPDEKIEKDLP